MKTLQTKSQLQLSPIPVCSQTGPFLVARPDHTYLEVYAGLGLSIALMVLSFLLAGMHPIQVHLIKEIGILELLWIATTKTRGSDPTPPQTQDLRKEGSQTVECLGAGLGATNRDFEDNVIGLRLRGSNASSQMSMSRTSSHRVSLSFVRDEQDHGES